MFDSRVNLLLIAMTVSFATTLAQAVDSPDVDAAIKELESKAEDRIAKAVAKLRNSAEGGNVKAMSNLAWHYYKKGDYTTAHTWYEKTVAADPTDSHAMYTLGVMYRLGRGVKRDFAKAMEWFRKSADKKNGSAMGKLGLMYARGESVKKDFVMAATWARKGAEIGSPTAMYVYGWALHNGEGVKEDKATGLDWLQKGATKGNKNAMEYVGKHHYKAREYDQAKKWYEKALASGSTTLQVMQEFATIHLEGRGVK
ncbi:MAG: tetratricopeptide repeat protein, partial [Pirellulaceae bacterium]|nr:tetratricopeptide repeat protein [Pirellulaceae bacterium]